MVLFIIALDTFVRRIKEIILQKVGEFRVNYKDLNFPFDEAENYFLPNYKEQLNKLFYRDNNYEKLLQPTTYYLIGDKGSGKTAYSAYFCNNNFSNIKSKRFEISVDDYCKIIQMKNEGKLNYTHYVTLWKAILLIKIFSTISDNEISFFGSKSFQRIKDLLNDYNFTRITEDSFSPVSFIDNESFVSSIGIKATTKPTGLSTNGSIKTTGESTKSIEKQVYIDSWVKFINEIEEEISSLKLKNHHYLFIDGIDTRPEDIPFSEYKECVYPLVRAVYDLNSNLFAKIKDRKKGRLQIVLLTRLDIFIKSGLSNPGSKVADNAAFLNWCNENESEYKNSELYSLVNNIINAGSDYSENSWESFFDFKILGHPSFVYLLRFTTCRPRDFVKILKTIKELCIKEQNDNPTISIIESDAFRRAYSTYYVDSLKTGLHFFYSADEINALFAFLKTIRKTKFTYNEFKTLFIESTEKEFLNKTFSSAEELLTLMFDNNMIGYIESEGIYRWHYKELSVSDYNYTIPADAFSSKSKLRFHPALEKELSLYLRKKTN